MAESVYEQLKKWQRIPHARAEWGRYRRELTDFIVEHTRCGSSAAVLGAGRCDDLDLGVLCGHFSRVVLVDRNPALPAEACRSWNLSVGSGPDGGTVLSGNPVQPDAEPQTGACVGGQRAVIELQQKDFLGITEEQYEDFSESLQRAVSLRGRNTDIAELSAAAQRKAEVLYQEAFCRELDVMDGTCDYVVTAGVHSQLNNMLAFIFSAYEQALNQRDEETARFFAAQNDTAVRRFDEAILKKAETGVVLACERSRLGIPGSVQGAAQALADFGRYEKAGRVRKMADRRLLWNFDLGQAVAYEMEVQAFCKNMS